MGRLEGDWARKLAMNLLGNGLHDANRYEDALSVYEAELSMLRRVGAPEYNILIAQGNLARTYGELGRVEETLSLRRHIYSRRLELFGEDHSDTLTSALNYSSPLVHVQRFEEAKSVLRKTMRTARRVLGESHELTFRMRWAYARALYYDDGATPDDLREAVTTLEDVTRIARRVLGSAHPNTAGIEKALGNARAALRAREDAAPGGDVSAIRKAVEEMTASGALKSPKLTQATKMPRRRS